jgi:hypothetical protein
MSSAIERGASGELRIRNPSKMNSKEHLQQQFRARKGIAFHTLGSIKNELEMLSQFLPSKPAIIERNGLITCEGDAVVVSKTILGVMTNDGMRIPNYIAGDRAHIIKGKIDREKRKDKEHKVSNNIVYFSGKLQTA